MGIRLPYMQNISNPAKKYIINFGGLNYTDNFQEGELETAENFTTQRSPNLASRKQYFRGYLDPTDGRRTDGIWSDGEIFASWEVNKIGNTTASYITFKTHNAEAVQIPSLDVLGGINDIGLKNIEFVRINNKLTVFTDGSESQFNTSNLISPYTINLDPDEDIHLWESTSCVGEGTAEIFPGGSFIRMGMDTSWLGGSATAEQGGICNYKAGDTVAIYVAAGSGADAVYFENPDFYGVLSSDAITVSELGTTIAFTTKVFEAIADTENITTQWVRVEKITPDGLYFPTAINNRIWAVKGNKIYASALGEPSRWESFEGVASDSYQVGVDSSREFTGLSEYNSNPIIFKEDIIYRIYGSVPSNFSLQKIDAPGVMEGCSKSIQKINEVIYYKGRRGIYRYAGGTPQCISDSLGDLSEYGAAVSGSDDRFYYLSMMKKSEDDRVYYIYDTQTGIWQKEDGGGNITSFASWGGVLYFFDQDGYNIYSREQDPEKDLTEPNDSTVPWNVTFKPFNETVNERKVYSRIYIRLELGSGSWATVSVKHDSKPWQEVETVRGDETLSTTVIPIRLKKCDKFTIKIEGKGDVCLKSLVREYRTAGDK